MDRPAQGRILIAGLVAAAGVAAVAAAWLPARHHGRAVELREPASNRPFRIVTAPTPDSRRPAPVLVALHAYASEPWWVVDRFRLADEAARRGWILVMPEGERDGASNRFWNAYAACCASGSSRPDDVGYLRAVLREVGRRYAIDRARVYAFGESNGGFMAHRWACEPGGDLAGLIGVASSGPGPDDPPCRPTAPVRVLDVHGDADETIRFEGGVRNDGRYPSAAETAAAWRTRNGVTGRETSWHGRYWLIGRVDGQEWIAGERSVGAWAVRGAGHNMRFLWRLVPRMLDFVDRVPTATPGASRGSRVSG